MPHEISLVTGDLSDPETYRQHLEDSDVLVHTVLDFDNPQETDEKLFTTLQQVAQNSRPQRQRLFIYTTGCSIDEDVTSTWFDQNEFITSGKIRRWLGWFPKHTGLIDEIETYYASWKATRQNK